jgi:hypothetical protein
VKNIFLKKSKKVYLRFDLVRKCRIADFLVVYLLIVESPLSPVSLHLSNNNLITIIMSHLTSPPQPPLLTKCQCRVHTYNTETRVARFACEKTRTICFFLSKFLHDFLPWTEQAKNMGFLWNFQKTTRSKQSSNGRNFAQSGHPDRDTFLELFLPSNYFLSVVKQIDWFISNGCYCRVKMDGLVLRKLDQHRQHTYERFLMRKPQRFVFSFVLSFLCRHYMRACTSHECNVYFWTNLARNLLF